jgi:hypothetical protein
MTRRATAAGITAPIGNYTFRVTGAMVVSSPARLARDAVNQLAADRRRCA